MDNLFKLQAILRQVHDPKMTLNTTRSNVPYKYVYTSQVSTIFYTAHLALWQSRFWITGHFDTSASNGPKMTLNTAKSKVNHTPVYAAGVREYQI